MSTTTDGRSARWEGHRQERRRELVESAIRTIRARGAGVGMDDIASAAGTSKTVFYRHFTDRHGLYRAIAARVDDLLLRDIGRALGQRVGGDGLSSVDEHPREVIAAAVGAYLDLVERDPELYRFIVAAPIVATGREGGSAEIAADVTGRIARQISDLIADALMANAGDPAPAQVWGQALVGMVRAAADAWLAGQLTGDGAGDPPLTRAVLTEHLTDLAWGGVGHAWGVDLRR